jgi:uncharacterized protein (DUF1330 family)
MAAYVIYSAEITDPEQYELYKAQAAPVVAAHGGAYIVRGGEIDVLEGGTPVGRTVILEFPNMEAARTWYDSDEYQAARTLRENAGSASAYIVDGVG